MRYTVKQASSLTGIAPDRLRAWERRYGIVAPTRTESGYRLYDDDDLARLRLMVRLVDSGTPASLAAEEVRVAYAEIPRDAAPSPRAAPAVGGGGTLPAPEALVGPAQSFDRAEVETLLDRAFAIDTFETVAEHWLLPALVAVGEAWEDGRVDVAGEHFVSSAVRRRLGRAFDAAGTSRSGPVVLVGLPPGSLHELGSLTFATCLRRLGVDVRWLGMDLPEDSWAHAVDQIRPAAVVISVPTQQDAFATRGVLDRLDGADAPYLFAGGAGAASVMGSPGARPSAATLLPFSVVEASQSVATKVRSTV